LAAAAVGLLLFCSWVVFLDLFTARVQEEYNAWSRPASRTLRDDLVDFVYVHWTRHRLTVTEDLFVACVGVAVLLGLLGQTPRGGRPHGAPDRLKE
jgi:hypothetical protein